MTAPIDPTKNLPSTRSKASSRQQSALVTMRHAFAGNEAVKGQTTAYLPKAPLESAEDYAARLARAVFHNFVKRTVEGLTGLVFRVDPVLGDDVPPAIRDHAENIDNGGKHLAVFAREQFADAITAGHNAILVDFPMTGGTLRLDEEQTRGIRPYWVPLKKEQFISWRVEKEDGRPVLAQLVIEECTVEPDGLFGEVERTRYRVFRRVRTEAGVVVGFNLLRVTERKEVVQDDFGLYPTQEEIPVAEVVTSGHKAMFESDPPLVDLAFLNLAHYQQWADYATSLHMTCVPFLFTKGFSMLDDKGQPIAVGANTGLNSKSPDGDAKYVTHDGAALAEVRSALVELKADMGAMGLAMLTPQKRAAETAEAKRIDKSGSDSAISVAARGLEDGMERALGFHARYLTLADGGSVSLNRDFEGSLLDPAVMLAYVQAAKDIGFPLSQLLRAFKDGGRIPQDVDLDELEMTMRLEAEAAAAEERKRLEDERREAEAMTRARGGAPAGAGAPGAPSASDPLAKAA